MIFIFYKVLVHYSVCQFPVSWARQCEGAVSSDWKCPASTEDKDDKDRDAIIIPEATLAAVTVSVNYYY